jgi:hypothetical protein
MRILAEEVLEVLRAESARDPDFARVVVERICRIRPEEGGPQIRLRPVAGAYAVVILSNPLEIVALATGPDVVGFRGCKESANLNYGGDFGDLAA